jgi:hypothetical protein
MAEVLGEIQDKIKATILHYAPRFLEHRKARKLSLNSEPMMKSAFTELSDFGHHHLGASGFHSKVKEQAQKTADSASRQVAKALDLTAFDPDLAEQVDELTDGLYDVASGKIGDSIERASDVLEQWAEGEEPDLDILDGQLDEGLDGILGGALALVALHYGWGWGEMNKSAQDEAGVSSYIWIAQHDSAVRPEHLALDGEEADWDDPPLSAEDSSSGEECHAGEDFNCRCVASPVPPGGLLN